MADFPVQPNEHAVSSEQRSEILANPGFGDYFTDHMATAVWRPDEGWHQHRIAAMRPFTLHPSTGGLHYGQEIFEGLKAYRHDDGSVWLFRPDRNAARFAQSARRLSMAPLDEESFLTAVRQLVTLDHAWVPTNDNEQSLYIRPFEFASEAFLGVRPSQQYTFAVIATPVGAYYPAPVRLWVTPNYTRAAPGGTGQAKCGGNYAGSLAAATEAREHGCEQVMWVDGSTRTWVEECGTMNIMFITKDSELITPALGTILEGVTRDSLLTLAPEHGLTPVERQISVAEVFEKVVSGEIAEVLACGTAAVVTPIIGLSRPGSDDDADDQITVADGSVGARTAKLRQHLLDIQYGRAEDSHGWTQQVI